MKNNEKISVIYLNILIDDKWDSHLFSYEHLKIGKSVVKDNKPGEIFHVGGKGFKYD